MTGATMLACRWSPILPKPIRMATAPAAYGLRAVRTATWVAAILMTAVGLRAGCFSLVDASMLAAQRCPLLLGHAAHIVLHRRGSAFQ
jgi:hypothetical protein